MRYSETSGDDARVAAALRAAFPDSVAGELIVEHWDEGYDRVVVVSGWRLRAQWKSRVWLSVAGQILALPDPPDLVIADRVSPASSPT